MTTEMPWLRARSTRVRAGSMPPISSTTRSMLSIASAGSVVSSSRSIGASRGIHIADENAAHLHFGARASGKILAAGLQDANDLATDGSGSKNANSEDGTGCRHRTISPLWDGH